MKRLKLSPSRRTLIRDRARGMRREMPIAEILILEKLRGDQLLGCRFRRQHCLSEFIVDFACPQMKLVIEVDGDSHVERADYDASRTEKIRSFGYEVLRFSNSEVTDNIDGVIERIAQRCQAPSPRDRGEGGTGG